MEFSNEKLLEGARNLKAKGYTPQQVDSWLQSKGSSLQAINDFASQPRTNPLENLTNEQKAKIAETRNEYNRKGTERGLKFVVDALMGFGEGVESGFNRLNNAATLGGYDWIDRNYLDNTVGKKQQELRDLAEAEGAGGALSAANLATDTGANLVGGGGLILKGAGKLGLKGLKMALGTAGAESAVYGLTDSDRKQDILKNILYRELIALPTAGLMHTGGSYLANSLGKYGEKALETKGETTFNLKKFIDSLQNPEKTNKMVNSVKQGAEDVADNARAINERLKRLEKGRKQRYHDEELEDALLLPETRAAKQEYNKFLNQNGDRIISQSEVEGFYKNNPVAKEVIEDARAINPQRFKGVRPNSIKEFDILKQNLRESRKSADTIGKPKMEALETAEQDVKTLMDNNAKGFRNVNQREAAADAAQDIHYDTLKANIRKVANTVKNSGNKTVDLLVTGLTALGGVNPKALLAASAIQAGRVARGAKARQTGRNLMGETTAPKLKDAISALLGLGSAEISDKINN